VREVVTTVNCAEIVETGDSHIVFARLNETSEMQDLSIHLPAVTSASSPSGSR
jgi:hypothetical protein